MLSVKRTGATWIRIAIPMPSNEYSQGQFTWYSDTEVKAALAVGLHVDALVGWPAKYALNSDGSPRIGLLASFMNAAIRHYDNLGVRTFEIWNEPNLSSQWNKTHVNIRAYAQLLRSVYPAAKRADPKNLIVLGGLAPVATRPGSASYSPQDFIAALFAAGIGHSFDAVALHPYSYPNLPSQKASWNPWTYLPGFHAILARHGDGSMKIWYTEFGAPVRGNRLDVTLATQARMYTEAFQLARQFVWSGPIFAYSWTDWDGDGSGYFGLHDLGGKPRPALEAFRRAMESTKSADEG